MFKFCKTVLLHCFVGFMVIIFIVEAKNNTDNRKYAKRGTVGLEYGNYLPRFPPAPWNNLPPWDSQLEVLHKPIITVHKHVSVPIVSPAEVEAAIKAAKAAAANVIAAQQHVIAAKEAVIAQQRIASAREAQAQAAQQKSEAIAQAQRAEATAAAQAVVLAQQRLAEAKAQSAAHQRIAAAKEAHAAHLIQKSATAAAIDIQRSEVESAKLAALQKSETAAIQHINAAKEANLAATSAAVSALPVYQPHYPSSYHPWG